MNADNKNSEYILQNHIWIEVSRLKLQLSIYKLEYRTNDKDRSDERHQKSRAIDKD